MPQRGQTSVSIPTFVWDYAAAYFEEHKKELRKKGIKSVTKLICVWIQEAALKEK